MENISLYNESLGEDSDVVHKEMYVFEDKNKSKIALRPEGTAGVMRYSLLSILFHRNYMFLYFSLFSVQLSYEI